MLVTGTVTNDEELGGLTGEVSVVMEEAEELLLTGGGTSYELVPGTP